MASYYPPRPAGEQAPVKIKIELDPDNVDRTGPIPQWLFKIEITLSDFQGVASTCIGSVEAMNEDQARCRVYCHAIESLATLLAGRVAKQPT